METAATAMLFAAALMLIVGAWLLGPTLLAALRRARIQRQPFAPAWREILRRRMPAFAQLPADVQWRLKKLAQVLIAEKPFIGCQGLVVTEEMRVLVSVQAALLLLRPGAGYFSRLRQVLIYPGPFVVEREVGAAAGLVQQQRRALSGESWQQGQVLLSWPDVLAGAADPQDGRNLVLHEFAHQLDQENGAANGAPWLSDPRRRTRWARVLGNEFEALQHRLAAGQNSLIDAYGASDPAEFFAVTSELFFERSAALASAHPSLFAELCGYYGVDPRAWQDSWARVPARAER